MRRFSVKHVEVALDIFGKIINDYPPGCIGSINYKPPVKPPYPYGQK